MSVVEDVELALANGSDAITFDRPQVRALMTEIEVLRGQLALLGGAAAATVASGVETGGLLDVLRACDRLHRLPAYQAMMAAIEPKEDAMLNVRFHADRRDLIFPDIEAGEAGDGEVVEVVVVDNGVDAGDGRTRPSVVLRIATDEQTVIVLTTARLLCTAARMIMARYPDLFEGDG